MPELLHGILVDGAVLASFHSILSGSLGSLEDRSGC